VAGMSHTVTLIRDDNRMGGHYGDHMYVERSGETVIKSEHLGTRDRDAALVRAAATAKLYGASLVDRRPATCLYGWSAD